MNKFFQGRHYWINTCSEVARRPPNHLRTSILCCSEFMIWNYTSIEWQVWCKLDEETTTWTIIFLGYLIRLFWSPEAKIQIQAQTIKRLSLALDFVCGRSCSPWYKLFPQVVSVYAAWSLTLPYDGTKRN